MSGPIDWSRLRHLQEGRAESLRALPLGEVVPSRRDFSQFIGAGRAEVGIVATLRRRDPVSGATWNGLDAATAAAVLDEAEIVGLAVTTEKEWHAGRLEDLGAVAAAATAPVLRDEPLLHPLQVYESRMRGADACVLVVAWMADDVLAEAVRVARSLHMTAVLAVAEPRELRRALDLDHVQIGVLPNGDDGGVDLERAARLSALVPARRSVLSLGEAERLADLRGIADAALVARALMGRSDLAAAIEEIAA